MTYTRRSIRILIIFAHWYPFNLILFWIFLFYFHITNCVRVHHDRIDPLAAFLLILAKLQFSVQLTFLFWCKSMNIIASLAHKHVHAFEILTLTWFYFCIFFPSALCHIMVFFMFIPFSPFMKIVGRLIFVFFFLFV